MKARVKATGVIIEVEHTAYDVNGRVIWRYTDKEDASLYTDEQLDFNLEENQKGSQIVPLPYEPDYWEKLKHQATIAAMQGILSSDKLMDILGMQKRRELDEMVADLSLKYATALVNKLKEEEK